MIARMIARRAASLSMALQMYVKRMVFGQTVGVGGTETVLGAIQIDGFNAFLGRGRQVLRTIVGQVPGQRGGRLWYVYMCMLCICDLHVVFFVCQFA